MGLLQKLKSTLGLGGSQERRGPDRTGDVGVTVEHEPDASSEAAVKGTDVEAEEEPPAEETATAEPSTEEEPAADAVEADTREADTREADTGDAEAEEVDTGEAEAGEAAGADVPVDDISGIGPAYAERLGNAGVETVADLAGADAASLAEEADIPQSRIEDWIERANDY